MSICSSANHLTTKPHSQGFAIPQTLRLQTPRSETFWQARYYDFNVFTHNKRVEKLKYMHRNPVTRGLVERPEDWPWSC